MCTAKESDTMDDKMDCFFKMFQIVRACLELSPYTHFYTQVLIDIIVKTYNTKTFRSDLLFKSQIGVLIEDSKYYPSEIFSELEENEYTPEILLQNNFTINKCENCGRLFIPVTSSNNHNQKGRNEQKYCDNLYLDTEKTCKEIGALNKQKEKVQNSPILIEYNREYKRIHGLHYNHQKKFTEKKFKEWSKKARKLRNNFTDKQLEEFKIALKNLSDLY